MKKLLLIAFLLISLASMAQYPPNGGIDYLKFVGSDTVNVKKAFIFNSALFTGTTQIDANDTVLVTVGYVQSLDSVGLTEVFHDETLTGTGKYDNVLKVDTALMVTTPALMDTLAAIGGFGDDWGAQAVVSDTSLDGDGTSGNPLVIHPGASGQILSSDGVGAIWVDIPVGDDQTAEEVPTDVTNFDGMLSPSDTTVQLALETLDNSAAKTSYWISLPSASTVADRIAAAVPGTDYPASWILTPGSSAIDLNVNHGLSERVSSVTVFAVNGTAEIQLYNTAAFSGIATLDENNLLIQSLSTVQRRIKIYINFAN